jgi:DNA-binding response OmpR family regulator
MVTGTAKASTASILIIEDDPTIVDVVTRYLVRDGFQVQSVTDGINGLRLALELRPDLIVLDIMLPGMSGLDVCRQVRASTTIPIVMLTALGDEPDTVAGLEGGADDYLGKPFSPRELVARIRSVLRRSERARAQMPQAIVRFGEVSVDPSAREVTVAGDAVGLTEREFDLLIFLLAEPKRVFTREELLQHVWGYGSGDTGTVTVHVRRLREKIEQDPSHPRFVKTVWGVGYRFDP